MALSIRQLAFFDLAGPSGVAYTVPAGKRVILRDWRLYVLPSGVGPHEGQLIIRQAAGGNAILVVHHRIPVGGPAATLAAVDAFIVLEAGDQLFVNSVAAEIQVLASGHEFTLP